MQFIHFTEHLQKTKTGAKNSKVMSNWKLRREQMLRAEKEYSLKNKGKLLNFIH